MSIEEVKLVLLHDFLVDMVKLMRFSKKISPTTQGLFPIKLISFITINRKSLKSSILYFLIEQTIL
jgi:hypothetical protein